MSDAIRLYLPWVMSAVTIWMTLLAGNKHRSAWLVWIITTAAWGLLPMNAALWIVYGRNHLKWRKA